MHLKSLKLTGFKSFADRTHLEFRPGVTVVVGPNGSGKSNLVDALSWVLGTQSTKGLRTARMEDVIFAGTATRPALSRAEVVLVIDNADRQLDLDLHEVAITRRLYRDGSSDYELNGVPCRLLDIQELLSDSGVGRHQHLIIGQGDIGEVLSASPDDNRAVIEDAAGILKHRRRKEKAERRLDRTAEDLVRLEDILGEITRQMRPLKRQAKAADKYDDLKAEVVSLRLYLSGRALAAHDRELTIATSERATHLELMEVEAAALGRLEADLGGLKERSGSLGSDLDRDTTAAALLETTLERLRRLAAVARERRRAMSDRALVSTERAQDLEAEASAIDVEVGSSAAERASLTEQAIRSESSFRRLDDEERALGTQVSLSPEGAIAAVRGELSALEASSARDRREVEAIDDRLRMLSSRLEAETAEIDELNEEIRLMDTTMATLQADYRAALTTREKDQQEWTKHETALAAGLVEVASAQARVEAIKAALHGGDEPEARAVLSSAPGALGDLMGHLDVPAELEAAVGAALGPWSQGVVFGAHETALHATSDLKGKGSGPATVVTIGTSDACAAREVAAVLGLEALVDLLGSNADAELARRFLGDVVLAPGWMSAWDAARAYPTVRIITPEGDLFTHLGARLAKPDGAGPVMLETAEVALEQARTEEARSSSHLTTSKRAFEVSRERERHALEALEIAEAALSGKVEAMSRLGRSSASIEAELGHLEGRRKALEEETHSISSQMLVLGERIDALQGEEAELAKVWEGLEKRRSEIVEQRESARSEWQEAATRLQGLEERVQMLTERRARLADELKRLGTSRTEVEHGGLEQVEEYARRALEVLGRQLSDLRERQDSLRQEAGAAATALSHAMDEHERLRSSLDHGRSRVGELDVRIAELRLIREAVGDSIRRDADAEVEAAYAATPPEYPPETDLEELLASKLAELSRLGPVNPLAAAEYRDLAERHDFLVAQISDVEGSRTELRKVIAALDREIEERFEAAFNDVAASFEHYFTTLFPGGRGRVRLVEPEEGVSGVVIDAQPMGKKVSQMTLLSGGERSLVALAFLFSVFEARPSPFYVLDEVEAALDDVNLRRFIRIVDQFRDRAQLVIVTHQQQTMEAADVLYGVTMEPGGASQALRKDMASMVEIA